MTSGAQATRSKVTGELQSIRVELSPGELVDKITILEIKAARITDPAKLANVRFELGVLDAVLGEGTQKQWKFTIQNITKPILTN